MQTRTTVTFYSGVWITSLHLVHFQALVQQKNYNIDAYFNEKANYVIGEVQVSVMVLLLCQSCLEMNLKTVCVGQ